MVGETRFNERHDHRNLLRIVASALSIETDKSAPSADRFVHVDVGVHKISQVSDDNATWFYASVLENIQLFNRRLPGNSSVGKDRQVRSNVGLADGAEN